MARVRLDDFLNAPTTGGTEPIDSLVKVPKVSSDPIVMRADLANDIEQVPMDAEEKRFALGKFSEISEGTEEALGGLPAFAGQLIYKFGTFIASEEDKKLVTPGSLKAPKNTFARRIRNTGLRLMFSTESALDKKFPDRDNRTFAKDLGAGATSVLSSLGIGLTMGPIAAGVAFGVAADAEGFFEATKKGKSTTEALFIGAALGLAEGTLEFVGLDKFIGVKGNVLEKFFRRAIIEATQEFSQQAAEGTIKTSTGLREFKGVETLQDILFESLYAASIGAALGGSASIAMSSFEQSVVKEGLQKAGMSEEKATEKSEELLKQGMHETIKAAEEVADESEAANAQIKDVVKEEEKAKAKEEELTLEDVQEKQARQKTQEARLSKEEIQQVAVERVKDEQLKGRLTKLDSDIKIVDKEIDSLERERRQLQKAEKSTKAVENKIDTRLEKRDNLDLQRADILTTAKEQFDLEKEQLEVKGATLTKIARQGIKDSLKALKEGKKLGVAQVEDVQIKALQVLQDSQLDRTDKGSFIKTIKNIRTESQLEKAIPKIEARIETLEAKAERKNLVKDIQKASKGKIDPAYREQIDSILESFDLKSRTEKTKQKRESRQNFLSRERQEGNLDFLPPDFFANLGTTTLDEMTTEELQEVRDQVAILNHVGSTKQRMLSEKGQKDLDEQALESAKSIYDKTNSTPVAPGSERWMPTKGKGAIADVKDKIDAYFAGHRKVEFISRTLGIEQEIFEKIQTGVNKELKESEKVYKRLTDSFQKFEKEMSSMKTKEVKLEGVGVELTREQMIGVALNSGNSGNIQRLLEGNTLTQEEIQIINEQLTTKEKEFVSEIFETIDSLFPETSKVTETLYGVRPPKVEGYFPIVEDFKTSEQAKSRQAEEDLFNQVFKTTFINRSFTKRRVGGTAPVNLDVFQVILNHVDGVIHYNSMAAQVRDVQKLIKHPTFQQAVSETMGDNIYAQFPTWLRDIANPQAMRAGNIFDKLAQGLRHNSTASLLAHRVSVSLLQGGSYFQTIKEIGLGYATQGLTDFHKDRKEALEFIYSKSPSMKNRKTTFDRELKDFMKSKQITQLTKNRSSWNEVMFSWITGIDLLTTAPTWLGAYQQGLDNNNNDEDLAVQYADGVVRRTQPSGSVENLSAVMRGSQWQKMWTMFMSHFANMHNQIVSTMDELKYSKEHPMRKISTFAGSMFWLTFAPALIASIIRSGGDVEDWEKHAKELVLYPFGGLLLIRDIMNMLIKGFDFGAPPALSGAVEFGRAVKSKDPQKKLRHGIKAVGIFSGKIPTQYADTLDGAIDLYNGETEDFRRLFFSEWALKPSKGKKKKKTKNFN